MSLETLLSGEQYDVERANQSAGISGGLLSEYETVYVAVNCRKQDASTTIKAQYAARSISITHTIFTQQDGLLLGDRFATTSIVTTSRQFYVVRGIRKREGIGGIDSFYLYDCEELRIA